MTRRLTAALVPFALAAVTVPAVRAEPADVVIEHAGLDLAGRLDARDGTAVAKGGVVLILHDALAHHGAEPIPSLQAGLTKRGIASLAITLSYGLNRRRGPFDCRIEQDHRNGDALDEISAWVGWLRETHKAADVTLVGHGRGGAQALAFAKGALEPEVRRIAALAPPEDTPEAKAEEILRVGKVEFAGLVDRAKALREAGEDDGLIEVPGFLGCALARVTAAAFLDYYGPDQVTPLASLAAESPLPAAVAMAETGPVAARLMQSLAPLEPKGLLIWRFKGSDGSISAPEADALAGLLAILHLGRR